MSVQLTMIRKDEVRRLADQELPFYPDLEFLKTIDLGYQIDRIDDDPISDHAQFLGAKNAGWNEV